MTTGDKPAGWYPDPRGYTGELRWWDGAAWTDDVRRQDAEVPGGARDSSAAAADAPTQAARGYQAAISASVWPVGAEPPRPAPVQFEMVEPNRTKQRIGLALAGVAIAAVSTTGGYFWGAAGDDGGAEKAGSAAAVSVPPSTPAPASGPGTPAASAPATDAQSRPPAAQAPLPAGLVARWKLDETSGTGAADSAGKAPATLTGTTAWSTERGGSAVFDGRGAIATAGPVLDTTASFTVSAWAKITDTAKSYTVAAQDGTQVSGFYLHYNKDAGTWAFVRTSDDTSNPPRWFTAMAKQPPRLGAWTHLAAVFDAASGTMTLYVDGVAQNSLVDNSPWKAGGPFTIGRATSDVDRFAGGIDDVQAYSRVLTAAEVAGLAAAR
ncbi:LamG-like jellyroll fold domain-containing protein [Yinghuangia soli]|uniref:DUF2510 domain-containing protein n=1 Tax=Yinghuangia soli TaxID=2908204 RepID=A0AA41Q831_9ACTN|nr:LamG-like jellyroll fold domain-containing protein [Yinghuangia soli]MCF2532972.1 DUF2510 domain-containing protein [Yinghuangia soli]